MGGDTIGGKFFSTEYMDRFLSLEFISNFGIGEVTADHRRTLVYFAGTCWLVDVISILKLSGWPTNLVFSQLKEYPISLNCYKDIYP